MHKNSLHFLAIILALSFACSPVLFAEYFPPEYHTPADRARAAVWLGKLKLQSAVPLLIQLCEDKDGAVRLSAVQALSEINDPKVEDVLKKLAADPSQVAVEGVLQFASDELYMAPPVRTKYNIQRAARIALLKLPPAVPGQPREATEAIADLNSLDRKSMARYMRKSSGSSDAIRKYTESEEYKQDNAVYNRGYEAVQMISLTKGTEGTKALAGLLGGGCENFELQAARILVDRDKEQVIPLIHGIIAKPDLSPLTLTSCLIVLQKLEPAATHTLALQLVECYRKADDYEWARMPNIAYSELRNTLAQQDIPLLSKLLESQTVPSRRTSITALITLLNGNLPPIEELIDMDEIPAAKLDEATVLFLKELNKPKADWLTFKASYQLGRLKVKDAVPGLLKQVECPTTGGYVMYKQTANYYQTMAAWALVQIADPESTPVLRKIALDAEKLSDGNNFYPRAAAVVAYGRLAKEKAVNDLAAILREEDSRLAGIALYGPNNLVAGSRDENVAFPTFYCTQEAAAYALAEIGDDNAKRVLVQYLEEERWLTDRIAAAIFHIAPDVLDAWSAKAVKSSYVKDRNIAVAIRLKFYTGKAGETAHAILTDPGNALAPLVITYLQNQAMGDASVTRDLASLLEKLGNEDSSCEQRLKLIEAIGRQGGPVAEAVLGSFAEKGGTDKTKEAHPAGTRESSKSATASH